jgi:hypothetical protein
MLDTNRLLRSPLLGLGLLVLVGGCTGSNDALQSGGGGQGAPPDAGPSGGAPAGGSTGGEAVGGSTGGAPVGGSTGGAPVGGDTGGDPAGGSSGGATGGDPAGGSGGGVDPDRDSDDDGVPDVDDNCPRSANNNQADADDDGLGDVCDPCPETPDPTGDPAACASACETGVVESRPCAGVDVREERACVEGAWSPWSGCREPPECTDGETEVQACPDAPAVTQVRVCADGRWGEYSACEPACAPETIERRPCAGAPALEQQRTCDGGLWSDWSVCEPECVGEEREVRDCLDGRPGTEYRNCEGGLWSAWSECVLTPECDAGARQTRACAAPQGPGTQSRDCLEGFWGGWSVCLAEPVCVDGAVEVDDCVTPAGRPGEAQRVCVGGFWGAFSACEALPECAAGQEQRRACGLNGRGEDRRVCVDGFYSSWSCTDPDECIDGSVRNQMCPESAAIQVSECVLGVWGPFSACPALGPCDSPVGLIEVGDAPLAVELSTVGRADAFGAGCGSGGRGADALYQVRVAQAGRYRFEIIRANIDTVLSLRALCEAENTELACNDDLAADNRNSAFEVDLLPGEYSLLLDAFGVGEMGTATVNIRPPLPPAACIDDDNETPATATPFDMGDGFPSVFLGDQSLCEVVDPRDYFGFTLPTAGLVFAEVRPTEPLTGGTVFGGFYRGNVGIGFAVESDGAFTVRTYADEGGDYTFGLSANGLNGPYGYEVEFYHSPSITCAAAQRPGCIPCTDALDPNDNINQARAINLNQDYANLYVCGAEADFYSVQLAANREVRIDVDINAMLGDFALVLTDGRNSVPMQMSLDGLRYTFEGVPPAAGRYSVNVRPNPGEVSYRLRVSQ